MEFGHRSDTIKHQCFRNISPRVVVDVLAGWEGRKIYHLKKQFSDTAHA